jgi:hypothetical protein
VAATVKHTRSESTASSREAGAPSPETFLRPAARALSLNAGRPLSTTGHRQLFVIGLSGMLLAGIAIGGRELLRIYRPGRLAQWDHLLRLPWQQQLTGFVLLGLVAAALVLPAARKLGARGRRLWFWRTVHGLVGVLGVAALIAHTGLRLGVNLNLWLSIAFLLLGVLGAFCAGAMGGPRAARAWSSVGRRLHVLLLWPALALIGLHVLASYYF